jgi:hypothetical protein
MSVDGGNRFAERSLAKVFARFFAWFEQGSGLYSLAAGTPTATAGLGNV